MLLMAEPWCCSASSEDIAFSDAEFHKREMTLIGSRNALKFDFDHVIASIAAGKVPMTNSSRIGRR
jgi:threonine dehydrogenase-like Zn-dependent dehydrogenase